MRQLIVSVGIENKIILSCADCICSPRFVFSLHPDQLHDIQQIVQGIGPVPEFMLAPNPGGNRQEKE